MRAEASLYPDPPTAAGVNAAPPLVAHVIYRLDTGGLENGLINLLNRMPSDRFRHAVICLTEKSDFSRRIQRDDVPIFVLGKPPGNSPLTHFRLWRLLKRLQPEIVHTRNLSALEVTLPAVLAGVRVRIHSEHGRDIGDLDGTNRKRQWLRRAFKPLVHQYIALSRDLDQYLRRKVGISPSRVVQIYNGVDSEKFRPAPGGRARLPLPGGDREGLIVLGTVGRMQEVKNPLALAQAFIHLTRDIPDASRLRLVMVGGGPLRDRVLAALREAGCEDRAWLPGDRDDIADIMRGLDLFVLPSLAEGVSNTILEAMATGLPVVATRVGGNPELVQPGVTGTLVPAADPVSLARAIRAYVDAPEMRREHGRQARVEVEKRFGMQAMVDSYMRVYEDALNDRRRTR